MVIFCVWVFSLSIIDLRSHRLPNLLTLPGAVVIAIWAIGQDPLYIVGGVAWASLYLLTGITVGGIGGGDIKFALGLGTVAASGGLISWLGAVVGASIVSLLWACALRRGMDAGVAHGPGMAIATLVAVLT